MRTQLENVKAIYPAIFVNHGMKGHPIRVSVHKKVRQVRPVEALGMVADLIAYAKRVFAKENPNEHPLPGGEELDGLGCIKLARRLLASAEMELDPEAK
jgi:hypothetical protein